MGSGTVLIGGMPAARMGDLTAHGGSIVLGCFTVLIGDAGGGGGGGGGSVGGGGGVPKGVGVMQAKKMANQEALKKAAKEGEDAAEKTDKEDFQAKFTLVDEANKPMKDVKYEIRTNDDQVHEGRTNGNGETQHLSGYTEADCRVTFLN